MELMHSKVYLGASGSNSQKHMIKFLDNYLTEQHWQLYTDPNVPTNHKLMSMAALLHSAGITTGEEKLFAFATAIATQTDVYDVDRLLIDTRRLKDHFVLKREVDFDLVIFEHCLDLIVIIIVQ